MSAFGQQFSLALPMVQAAVVLIITPLFVAGSIVEETERRTLEFLLATDLRPREIVVLNPHLAWSELTFRFTGDWRSAYSYRTGWPDGTVEQALDVWPSALGVGFYGLLAVGFYLAAARWFEREGPA